MLLACLRLWIEWEKRVLMITNGLERRPEMASQCMPGVGTGLEGASKWWVVWLWSVAEDA
jgi:hypothetical protein